MTPALASLLSTCVLRDQLDIGDMDADQTNTTVAQLLTSAEALPPLEAQVALVRASTRNDVGAWVAERRIRDVCLRPIRPDGSCAGEALGVWKLVTNSGRVVDQKGCE